MPLKLFVSTRTDLNTLIARINGFVFDNGCPVCNGFTMGVHRIVICVGNCAL